MATHYRKLLNESIEDSITDFCSPYCEPEKNQLGLCPLTCITFCYPICNRPFLAAIPTPPQDNITTTTLDDHHENEHYKSSQILALSLSILVIALVFLLFYAICKFCNAWCNSTREESELQRNEEGGRREEFLDQDLEPDRVYHPVWYIRSAGLQPSVISSINICKYKKGDGLVEGTECSVCLNEFQEDETLRLLPKCNHAFHIPCIDTWLTSHTNCPMCRADIVLNPLLVSPSSPEQNLDNSRALEETHEPGSANQGEFEMEREYEFRESRVEHEDEGKSQIHSAVNSNQDSKEESENSDSRELEGVQPLRRSVSLLPLSASLISDETANADPAQSDKELNKVNESREGVFANRVTTKSLSRTSQVLSRHSRSRN